MSTTASPNKGSLAANLPPEVLGVILSFAVPMRSYMDKQPLKNISLVCRSWCEPTRRLLFRTLLVISPGRLGQLGRDVGELGRYIRKLTVMVNYNERAWTVEELNSVLELVPFLASLKLCLYWTSSPGCKGDYSRLRPLPHLASLTISYKNYDRNMICFRQILLATPNITRLSLSATGGRRCILPNRQDLVKISLPALVQLSLWGDQLCLLFEKFELLTESTLRQITTLKMGQLSEYRIQRAEQHSPFNLLAHLKDSLRTLVLQYINDREPLEPLLNTCPHIENIVVELGGSDGHEVVFKTATRTLNYDFRVDRDWIDQYKECHWLLDMETVYGFPLALVKRLEIDGGDMPKETRDLVVARYDWLELVLDGVVYKPNQSN